MVRGGWRYASPPVSRMARLAFGLALGLALAFPLTTAPTLAADPPKRPAAKPAPPAAASKAPTRPSPAATAPARPAASGGAAGAAAGTQNGESRAAAARQAASTTALARARSEFTVLAPDDIVRYRTIFSLQQQGEFNAADRIIREVKDKVLMGHVDLLRLLHPTAYRAQYPELVEWLGQHADHPGADRAYRLAILRQPRGTKPPPQPRASSITVPDGDEGEPLDPPTSFSSPYRSPRKRSAADAQAVANIQAQVRDRIRREDFAGAEAQIAQPRTTQLLDTVEVDQLRWEMAANLFVMDQDAKAYELAHAAALRSRANVEIADWTAGLAAWRLGKYEDARKHFEALAASEKAGEWNLSAGAFWAARANLKLRRPQEYTRWLERGARFRRTFYGLLSARMLGEAMDIASEPPPLDRARFDAVAQTPGIRRAIALGEIGQQHLAEREIRQLASTSDRQRAEVLLALSNRLGLPNAAMALGKAALDPQNPYSDGAAFPVPGWELKKGYTLDRALVFAFIRQESEFNTRALSPVGARGLMQLMPATASAVGKNPKLRDDQQPFLLYEPDLNLELGQRYLAILLQDDLVRGNLFMLAAAYNAGPGNLNKWWRRMAQKEDPLMFIESIPARETRLFIQRVAANYWIYRLRLGESIQSMDSVLGGNWPQYASSDGSASDGGPLPAVP